MTPQQIDAMKLALEALELLTDTEQTFGALDYGDNAITALEETLAEHAMREVQRLGQEIEQEPVCPDCKAKVLYECVACSSNNYPPQRTWVDLTDEEVFGLFGRFTAMTGKSWLDLYRMTEAKLKEKNT